MSAASYDDQFATSDHVLSLGTIPFPSGRIVACDPYFCAQAVPFERAVPVGEHGVLLRLIDSAEWGLRIASARIDFVHRTRARRFVQATVDGGGAARFVVESGVASFMDETTRAHFAEVLAAFYKKRPGGNYYTDILAAEFNRNALPGRSGKWNVHRLPDSELPVAMFASGLGDGAYESFWGLDADGQVVSLTTDFGLL